MNDKDNKNKANTTEIESVEFIYNGKDDDFITFLKAVYSDFLTENRTPANKISEDEKNDEK
ncbi:MAG: hypothetical protein IKH51_11435 [Clostridia bacterium]|nr:hypothetical protein [Clostridia bacterium]